LGLLLLRFPKIDAFRPATTPYVTKGTVPPEPRRWLPRFGLPTTLSFLTG